MVAYYAYPSVPLVYLFCREREAPIVFSQGGCFSFENEKRCLVFLFTGAIASGSQPSQLMPPPSAMGFGKPGSGVAYNPQQPPGHGTPVQSGASPQPTTGYSPQQLTGSPQQHGQSQD